MTHTHRPTTPKTKTLRLRKIVLIVIIFVAIGVSSQFIIRPPAPQTATDYATVQRSLPYCNSKDPSQTLDFYRPQHSASAATPLVVYIHGGGWRSGNKSNRLITTAYGPFFLQHGIAVASIDYRLHSKNPYPDQNDDVACALSYLNIRAQELNINPQKVILFGDSAGGQLAALTALNADHNQYRYEPPRGVIDFYGVSDFSELISGQHSDANARRYLGPDYHSYIAQASPVTYIRPDAPRFLIVHGTKDKVVPMSQSQELYDGLTTAGNTAHYLTIPGARHGFIGPELPRAQYQIIQRHLTTFLQETAMVETE